MVWAGVGRIRPSLIERFEIGVCGVYGCLGLIGSFGIVFWWTRRPHRGGAEVLALFGLDGLFSALLCDDDAAG